VLFPTVTFAIFFLVVFTGVWSLRRGSRPWKLFLLSSGAVFYAWWDMRFLALLATSIAVNHVVARRLDHSDRRRNVVFVAGVAANLILLGFFKYYGFFADSLERLAGSVGFAPSLPLLDVILPVGISFFTFEAISYLAEVRRGVVTSMPLLDFATYLSFFPKLTSGPITRPSEFTPQYDEPHDRKIEAPEALWLIARGLFKKVVVASYLADAIVDGLFATPGQYSAGEALVGIYAYAAQIYVDFSGYTDMAIGLALLLGFRLPENFRSPYRATSVRDFWSRWHMTLTRWVRDFTFWPLAKRAGTRRYAAAWNMFLVMLLVGLWHGAGWTFVVWGGIHGVAMAVERIARERRRSRGAVRPRPSGLRLWVRWLATFHVVSLAWVFFRAHTLEDAFAVLARLGSFGAAPGVTGLLAAVLLGLLALQFVPAGWTDRWIGEFARLRPVAQAGALSAALVAVDVLGPEGVAPFIYFRF
jgi:D-alanyl-lipoteichoic acid acyltransferase DltB (MBOAT superfamily)